MRYFKQVEITKEEYLKKMSDKIARSIEIDMMRGPRFLWGHSPSPVFWSGYRTGGASCDDARVNKR